MKNSNLPWAKTEHTSKVIDLENLFNDYWTSKEHEIVVLGRLCSSTNWFISDGQAQRSLMSDSMVALSNCDSLQMLPFVSLQLPITASY